MFHVQERQLSLSSLFGKHIHNAVRHYSCFFGQNDESESYTHLLPIPVPEKVQ